MRVNISNNTVVKWRFLEDVGKLDICEVSCKNVICHNCDNCEDCIFDNNIELTMRELRLHYDIEE